MKRLLLALLVGYAVIGAATRLIEATGRITCDCYPDCWCRKPGLSLFRWVFPQFHHNART